VTPASAAEVRDRLTSWFRRQLPDAEEVRIEGIDRVDFGHSAEMMVVTLATRTDGGDRSQDVVVRLRPREPGLLEPYDMERQFQILRALEPTEVRAPRALWLEPSDDVLGRSFYVMERVGGEVYEREVPEELDADPERIRRMCENLVDQVAAIHAVDLDATGLHALGDGRTYLDRELDRWASDMRRVQRGPLPALERLLDELRAGRPEPCSRVTLVHGDAKPGNFAFVGSDVTAVFDWEMADVGDPRADVGYMEVMWAMPVGITTRPSALSVEEVVARYQERTGITVENREWYRAFQAFKLAVIMLLGSMLFEAGHSDDFRYVEMAWGVNLTTRAGLRDLRVEETLEAGPVFPSDERIAEAQARGAALS
jgi:aminoglycoside phosphotransferase (APT) family kinase protein